MKEIINKFKEFKLTSWAVSNRTTVSILTLIIVVYGLITYKNLPKEQFPDIVIPTVYVQTIYPGTAPEDIENVVTKIIEKQMKSMSGVKKINSTSAQDFSTIIVEFNTDVDVEVAKDRVKDAVDKAKTRFAE